MKHLLLCLFMICAFTVSTVRPFMDLNAAELWNSRSGAEKPSKGYYNKRKSSKGSGSTIYNRNRPSSEVPVSNSGLRSSLQAYKKMKVSRDQKSSKLWSKMSSSAVMNRQADIDNALQREYKIRKRTTARMIAGAKQREADRIAGEKKYKALLEKIRADKNADKAERAARKERALKNPNARSTTSSSKRVYKSSSKKRDIGLKKPKKLFNNYRN